MKLFFAALYLLSSGNALAQMALEESSIKKACLNYIEGFYEGDTTKLNESLKPSLYKYGYWKSKPSGNYEPEGQMTFPEAIAYAKKVFDEKKFAKPSAPKAVRVLDVSAFTASAKVTAWWGTDYLLLSKQGGKWMIEQVLWEGPLAPRAAEKSAFEKIDSLLTDAYNKFPTGSISVGIIRHDTVLWKKSYGYADKERKVAATSGTLYRIGSITKLFTAAMLLQLEEKKKLQISAPVGNYLAEFREVEKANRILQPISFVQLATHVSGMQREPRNDSLYTAGNARDWERILLSSFADIQFRYEPGVRYSYSNIGYAVLGLALSRVAGKPYTEYITDSIIRPLGMDHTVFDGYDKFTPQVAKGYVVSASGTDTVLPLREHQGRGYRVPNGGLYSSIDDMAQFAMLLMNESKKNVLKKETLTENYRRLVVTNARFSSAYGIGYIIERTPGLNIFGHGGTVAGYDALLAYDNTDKIALVFLHNATGDRFNSFELGDKIFGILKERND